MKTFLFALIVAGIVQCGMQPAWAFKVGGLNWVTGDGTVNQCIKTDGAGNLGWESVNGSDVPNTITSAPPQLTLQAIPATSVRQNFINPAASGHHNFSLGVQDITTESWTVTPSTAADGTTFTTPALTVNSNGVVNVGSQNVSGFLFTVDAPVDSPIALFNSDNSSGGYSVYEKGGVVGGYVGAAKAVYGGSASATDMSLAGVNSLILGSNTLPTLTLDASQNATFVGNTYMKAGLGAVGIGTTTTLFAASEQVSNLMTVTSSPTASTAALADRLNVTGNTASTQNMGGGRFDAERTITGTVTDTGRLYALRAGITLANSGQAYTNSAQTAGLDVFALTAPTAPSMHYSSIAVNVDSVSVTGRKEALFLEGISGGTNNAFIADNTAYTGNYFINSTSTNASLFSGDVTMGGSGTGLTVTNAASLGSLALGAALPVASGGTGQTTAANAFVTFFESVATTLGDLVYGGASGTPTRLAGSTSATPAVLMQTGTGSGSAAPAWTLATGTGAPVLATSATLVTPALGTPSALVGTNITGTAASLTAGHVTTNANLTGPITSVGNATSIASQTGTGSTFVVQTSPTLSGTIGGALAWSGLQTFNGGAASTFQEIVQPTSTGNPGIEFLNAAASGHKNWKVSAQDQVTETLTITPSTAADGTTFTTPAVTVHSNGTVAIGTDASTYLFNVTEPTNATVVEFSSANANGGYGVWQNSGTPIGYFGSAKQVMNTTLADFALSSKSGKFAFGTDFWPLLTMDEEGNWVGGSYGGNLPGTIAVTASGGTITGTSTKFLTDFRIGDTITANTETHTITAITSDTAAASDNWTSTASGQTYVRSATPQTFELFNNGNMLIGNSVSRTTITNLGNSNQELLIGYSAATTGATTAGSPREFIVDYSGATATATNGISMIRARGTEASPGAASSGDTLGVLNFIGYDTSVFSSVAASINALTTQTFTSSAHGSQITLKTTPNGSTTIATALTLDQDQSATFGGAMINSHLSTGTNADTVCLKSDGTFLIQAAACTISSRRFKENIDYLGGTVGLDEVMALKPVQFNMKPEAKPNADTANFGRTQIGLIAEDVEKVDKRLAIYEPDGKTPKSYRQEAMIGLLVKAVQEQQAEIKELKTKLAHFSN